MRGEGLFREYPEELALHQHPATFDDDQAKHRFGLERILA